MKRKRVSTSKTRSARRKERTFATLQEVVRHFFPSKDARHPRPKGDERGTRAADQVFAEAVQARTE